MTVRLSVDSVCTTYRYDKCPGTNSKVNDWWGKEGWQLCTAKHGHDTILYIPQKIKGRLICNRVIFRVLCNDRRLVPVPMHHTMKTC